MTRLHIGSPASTKQSRSQVSRGESTRSRTNFTAARAATGPATRISLHRRVEPRQGGTPQPDQPIPGRDEIDEIQCGGRY